jgi:hypothetical protein
MADIMLMVSLQIDVGALSPVISFEVLRSSNLNVEQYGVRAKDRPYSIMHSMGYGAVTDTQIDENLKFRGICMVMGILQPPTTTS